MLVQIGAISRQRGELLKSELLRLEREMTELVALRRALCLLNATRDRPKGFRRRLDRTSARSARSLAPRLGKTARH
jgi:hypothetical protein